MVTNGADKANPHYQTCLEHFGVRILRGGAEPDMAEVTDGIAWANELPKTRAA
jgi:hypothetical protein